MERRADDKEALVNTWFAKYDKSKTGAFEREEMRQLLTATKRQITGDSAAEVKEELLDKVMARYGTTEVGRADPGVTSEHALMAVKRYKYWMKEDQQLQEVFASADTDGTGVLTPDQLKVFLRRVANEKEMFEVKVTQCDVDFVMERCDLTGEGSINQEEAGPAVALWLEIVPEPAGCCGSGSKPKKVAPAPQ